MVKNFPLFNYTVFNSIILHKDGSSVPKRCSRGLLLQIDQDSCAFGSMLWDFSSQRGYRWVSLLEKPLWQGAKFYWFSGCDHTELHFRFLDWRMICVLLSIVGSSFMLGCSFLLSFDNGFAFDDSREFQTQERTSQLHAYQKGPWLNIILWTKTRSKKRMALTKALLFGLSLKAV